jgi:3'(2'), 5'-bisphosphate nucleotidase
MTNHIIDQTTLEGLLPHIHRIAREAGEKIMEVYEQGFDVMEKDDKSPLTTADLAAHHHIEAELAKLSESYPLLSEESASLPFAERSSWHTYWLVDPLDGTKEFIKRNGEFTVNIALISDHQPVLGAVYVPVSGVSYFAAKGVGAFKQQGDYEAIPITARKLADPPVVAGSRSHSGDMQKFLDKIGEYDQVSMGSSLKICLVAEGEADLYPRLWLTSEWDTAAAHAIVNEAGGQLVKTDMQPLLYNTKDSLLNPFFFVVGKEPRDWSALL